MERPLTRANFLTKDDYLKDLLIIEFSPLNALADVTPSTPSSETINILME